MQAAILLLINPLGNKKRIGKILTQISSALTQKNIPFETFIATWPQEINSYKEVWVVGGDGTMNFFLNFYKTIRIPVVIFKGGTGNDFATKLYGNITVTEQIDMVLNVPVKNVDAAECNGRKFINGVGIGFDGEVLKSMASIRRLGGHMGYLSVVIRKIFSFKEQSYKIEYADTLLTDKFLLVMITNSTTTGGGFIVSPEARVDDGKLNMILCKPQGVIKRLQYLPVIEKGKHLSRDFILHKEVDDVKIDCEKATLAQIDGELISAKTFEIKVLPQHYLFKY